MSRQQLFRRSQQRLALAYGGVMGVILTGLGFGVYQAIAHAHAVTADRELRSVAGTLHDSLQWKLIQPGKLEPILTALLPNLCPAPQACPTDLPVMDSYTLSAVNQGNYYVRLWDQSGQLVAIAGRYPSGLETAFNPAPWQNLAIAQENYTYHQISIPLHTQNRQDWGTLQVGRSLQDIETYLSTVRWSLGLGIPLAMILVSGASSWLSGLAMRPIDRAYRQIQQFTADAAHELRTPISAMLATVESALLNPELDPEDSRDIFVIMQRQNRRLGQLVADLLLLSRLEQQPHLGQQQACFLGEIITDLVEELAALAIAAQLDLQAEITDQTDIWLQGNVEQLYRLVSNLIINAIHYTPAGGTITVSLHCNKHQAVIDVSDTGIGIPLEAQAKIFDRFYRVTSDRSRQSGGSGLGLALARAIVQLHHGSIKVHSTLNQGSVFTITLPCKQKIRQVS